jgi:hypothetical protein|tara:strand:- start:1059 stop:1262 length:204 start_codon:yes stop_codon:yes gene_type:complete
MKKKETVKGFSTVVNTSGEESFAIFATNMRKLELAWRRVTHGLLPFDPKQCNRVGIMSMGLVDGEAS